MKRSLLFFALLAPALLSADSSLPNFRSVARKIRPAVVNLSVVKDVKAGALDPFMGQFFGRFYNQPEGAPQQSFKQRSLGSGVIVDAAKGYVLTNNHVVEGADAITVKLSDKRELPGVVVGRDPKTDLAVVRIKGASGLTAATFGDSDKMEVGDWVLAVGSPFGLEQTVSHGIISAKGRVIGDGPYDDFLQTDAPINPGNSGGPLVDLDGQVIGINTAISTQSGGSEGIGFAIPGDLARGIYHQLVSKGKVVRGWLGISIQDLDAALSTRFGLPAGTQGVLVSDVMDPGPARTAGLKSGDVVLAFNGRSVADVRQLQRRVAAAPVGEPARLKIWRDASAREVMVTVGDMEHFDAESSPVASEPATTPRLGLELRPLSADEASRGNGEGGAVVTQVDSGSPAEDAGVQAGDIIVELGPDKVGSPGRLADLAQKLKPGQAVVLRVLRDGRSLYLTVQLGDGKQP